jgi:hypothetical protein
MFGLLYCCRYIHRVKLKKFNTFMENIPKLYFGWNTGKSSYSMLRNLSLLTVQFKRLRILKKI